MDWQTITVGLVVALATVYLARRTWRTWHGATAGCGGGCSCSDKATSPSQAKPRTTWIPTRDLVLRRRGPER